MLKAALNGGRQPGSHPALPTTPDAFAEAARFGPAVDRFFIDILVMTDDPGLRLRRLALLKRLERLILRLADVSEIVKED